VSLSRSQSSENTVCTISSTLTGSEYKFRVLHAPSIINARFLDVIKYVAHVIPLKLVVHAHVVDHVVVEQVVNDVLLETDATQAGQAQDCPFACYCSFTQSSIINRCLP
jgi:hypothetical protein